MAVVTVQRFRKAYPEFRETAEELVQQKLDAADERINDSVFGDNVSIRATMLLAAHLLAISPSGEQARIWVRGSQTTMYKREFDDLSLIYTFGSGRVI
jgi:uncharacterized protein YaiI (UPF0178 family)